MVMGMRKKRRRYSAVSENIEKLAHSVPVSKLGTCLAIVRPLFAVTLPGLPDRFQRTVQIT
jgi:hypothetical protein